MSSRNTVHAAALLLFAGLVLTTTAQASLLKKEGTPDQQRAEIRQMRDETLAQLYKAQPAAGNLIKKAAGYAVFSNFGMKILVAGGGSGSGVVVDNKTRKETFMKMAEVQAGLGLGVKKFRLVWVFEKKSDMDRFTNSGWDLGGQTTASALGVGMAPPLLRRDVLWLTLAGGSDLGSDLPADRKFPLGGPGSFPGLELGELRVSSY